MNLCKTNERIPPPSPLEGSVGVKHPWHKRRPLAKTDFSAADQKRYWEQVQTKEVHECWEWRGRIDHGGYGVFSCHGLGHKAHRVSFVLAHHDLASEPVCDHKCRNRRCVNPGHLRSVTVRENSLENSQSVSAINNAKTHCCHGHEFTTKNTRICQVGGTPARVCRKCSVIAQQEYRKRKALLNGNNETLKTHE